MEELDLNVHSIEEIPGKTVTINGVRYVFVNFLDEGGESLVYRMANVESGLVDFVGKVFKYRPGSEEYEEKKANSSATEFVMIAHGVPAVHAEYYEIPGALFCLQRSLAEGDDAAYHRAVMNRAAELMQAQRFPEAAAAYDEVLAANPKHTHALLNKASALLYSNQSHEALSHISRAIDIEANDRDAYQGGARFLVALRRPEAAIALLEQTLARWKLDFQSWKQLMEIAIDHDLVETADGWLEKMKETASVIEGIELVKTEGVKPLVAGLEESRRRFELYRDCLNEAVALQHQGRWQEALAACERGAAASAYNFMALLNMHVCQYHLGRGAGLGDEVAALLYSLRGIPQFSCAALALLCYAEAGEARKATSIALLINSMVEHPMDLPRIPVAVTEAFTQEVQKVGRITATLENLRTALPRASAEAKEIEELLTKYSQLETEAHS